jgi:hypothetical protein
LWVSEPDQGPTDAINKGLQLARGDIAAYLTAGDCYRAGAFQAVAEAFEDPECFVLVGECDVIDAEGRSVGVRLARLDAREDLLRWWKQGEGFCIPKPAVFFRRSALEAVGLFDGGFRRARDLEMWIRLAKIFPFTVVRRTLGAYLETPERKARRLDAEMVLECDRAARMHIDLAPPDEREALIEELDRHAADRLLAIAEEHGDRAVLKKALGFSPSVAASTKFWRTLVSARAPGS